VENTPTAKQRINSQSCLRFIGWYFFYLYITMELLMRRNTPVTQNEYLLNEGSTLMSTTNTHSHITYANSAFIEASGYKEENLLGEPHNVIRHPDMPAEAFGDMWFTLQQGELDRAGQEPSPQRGSLLGARQRYAGLPE
jgi:PAS domain-containing protein